MKKKIFIILIVSLFLFTGCQKKESDVSLDKPISQTGFFLDTLVDIKIFDSNDPKIIQDCFSILKDIENTMSRHNPDTELSKVNSQSGKSFVKVSKDTFYVVEKGLEYHKFSDGLLDLSIGPIASLWNIGTKDARVPDALEIKSNLSLVNSNNIILDKKNSQIMLKKEGMILDLGAIAKGFAGDKITDYLKSKGIKHAILNLGGNVVTLGTKIDNNNWKVAIQNPFDSRGSYLATVDVNNKHVVTSGIYERYLEKNGKRYHHILNPFTGYPQENDVASISVIADKGIDADALSTSLFMMGPKEGLLKIKSLNSKVDVIFVTKDKKIYMTKNIKKFFKLTDSNFDVIN